MSTSESSAVVKVEEAYPAEKAWKLNISFPDRVEGLTRNASLTGALDYSLYQFHGWTDEPLDLNDLRVVAFNEDAGEFKVIRADDDDLPERVQMEMLDKARRIIKEKATELAGGTQ